MLLDRFFLPIGVIVFALWFTPRSTAFAKTTFNNPATAEGWAWTKIKKGEPADFDERCGAEPLDGSDDDEAKTDEEGETSAGLEKLLALQKGLLENAKQAQCRHIKANFLVDVLTKRPWRDQIPYAGVHVVGARIVGDIDLTNANISRVLYVEDSKIKGGINLNGLRTDSDLNFSGSRVSGDFSARQYHGEQSLFLDRMQVDGDLNADSLHVGVSLFMRNGASFNKVWLVMAKIAGQVSMNGARFDGKLIANAMQVGATLFMRDATFKKEVNLRDSKVGGNVEMDSAVFEAELNAKSLQVKSDWFMRGSFRGNEVDAAFASIGGNLDLRSATIFELDLSGATVTGELMLGAWNKRSRITGWQNNEGEAGDLILRNTRIGDLLDLKEAWPEKHHLHLEGFSLSHFGGHLDNSNSEARKRRIDWWDEWARRDDHFSPHPYQQLAATFTAAGDRDLADDISYAGHVREHEGQTGLDWIWSAFLRWVAGFGVGRYTFRVLYWVLGISLVGALYLRQRSKGVRAAGYTFLWCWGASLTRLLPVIEINKEFTDFFNDPRRERLTGFQMFVFSIIGVLGWFLAAILVAAVSGVTHSS